MADINFEVKFKEDPLYLLADRLRLKPSRYKISDEDSLESALYAIEKQIQNRQSKNSLKRAAADRALLNDPKLLAKYDELDSTRLKPEDMVIAKAKIKDFLKGNKGYLAASGGSALLDFCASVLDKFSRDNDGGFKKGLFYSYVGSSVLSGTTSELLDIEIEKRFVKTQNIISEKMHREFDAFTIAERQAKAANADQTMQDVDFMKSAATGTLASRRNIIKSAVAIAGATVATYLSGGIAALPLTAGVVGVSSLASYFINKSAFNEKIRLKNKMRSAFGSYRSVDRQMYVNSYGREISDPTQKGYEILDKKRSRVEGVYNKFVKMLKKYAWIGFGVRVVAIGGIAALTVSKPINALVTAASAMGAYAAGNTWVNSYFSFKEHRANFANAYKSFKQKHHIKFGKEKIKANANTIELDHIIVNKRDPNDATKASDEILFSSNEKLHIGPGITLLSGESGAGKSSLINLLLHSNDIDGGAVRIGLMEDGRFNGTNYNDLAFGEPAKNIALCMQSNEGMEMTVDEYIRQANPYASEEFVQRIKDVVGINEIPGDKLVSSSGSSLSGGERKRLNLAQTLIKDSPIMILDEPMEGIDRTRADRILDYLNEIKENKTIIYVTHIVDDVKKLEIDQALDLGIDQGKDSATMLRYDLSNPRTKEDFLTFFADRRVERSPSSGDGEKEKQKAIRSPEIRPATQEIVKEQLSHARARLQQKETSVDTSPSVLPSFSQSTTLDGNFVLNYTRNNALNK